MTAASFPLFSDPLFSIVSEESDRVYVSKPFVFLGCMAMLLIRVLGPLLQVQLQLYRLRQTSTMSVVVNR